MELFSISCTTCSTRLKVQDESVIGQILSCPKCSSMVMVEAPSGWAGSTPASAMAETKDDIHVEDVRKTNANRPPRTRPAATRRHASTTTIPKSTVAKDNIDSNQQDRWREGKEPNSTNVSDPILPSDQWTSDSARRRKQIMLFCVAGATGLVMAFALFTFIAFQLAKPATTNSVAVDLQDKSNNNPNVDSDVKETIEPTTDAAPNQTTEEKPTKTTPNEIASTGNPDVPRANTDDTSAVEPANENDKPSAIAPPGLVPRENPKLPDSGEASPHKSLLDGLGSLLEDAPFDAAATSEPSPDLAALTDGHPPDFIPLPRPEPREVDIDARLADPLHGIDFADDPLDNIVHIISQMSTIPITLDPEALIQVKTAPDAKVTIRLTGTTIGDFLEKMLMPIGLAFLVQDQQLVITRLPSPDGELRETTYRIDDLVESDEELAKLGEMLIALLELDSLEDGAASSTVELRDKSIVLKGTEAVHFQVLLFCEKLRVARGLKPLSDYDASIFQLASRSSKLREKLSNTVSLNYIQPTRFVEILQRITQETKVSILVDWHALAEIEWTPDAESTLTVNEQPLSEVLRTLLEPMELTYRIVDSSTIQVTTPKALANHKELEIYPIAKLRSDEPGTDEFITRITAALDKKGETDAIQLDSRSQHLIALLAQPDQVKLETLLSEWGDK